MSNNGYILVYKKITDNCLWYDKPYARGQAWIDLIMMANYKSGKMFCNGVPITVERGQVFRTIKYLSNRWGWSPKKTRGFLTFLETEKMASTIGLPQGTLITIENYNNYQVEGQTEDTSEDTSEGITREHKRIKNNKERIKNTKKRAFVPPSVDEVKAYCTERKNRVDPNAFIDFYQSKNWMVGKNKMSDWKAAVRNWERGEAGKDRRSVSKLTNEPPKYKVFEPEPDVDAVQMPDEIRERLGRIF